MILPTSVKVPAEFLEVVGATWAGPIRIDEKGIYFRTPSYDHFYVCYWQKDI